MPQEGRAASPVTVATCVWVTVADEQYALPKAITVDATSVLQAPSAQSITEWVFEVVTLTQDASNKKNKR
jgi:hypothetical protein